MAQTPPSQLDREQFARALLARLGAPDPAGATIDALLTWFRAEGGGFGNVAAHNPLNTTLPYGGSRPVNSVGVQAYGSDADGIEATARTLEQSNFHAIWVQLTVGTTCRQLGPVVGASAWGTPDFTDLCLPDPQPAPPEVEVADLAISADGSVTKILGVGKVAPNVGHQIVLTIDATGKITDARDVDSLLASQGLGQYAVE